MVNFQELFKKIRTDHKLTQKEFGESIGTNQGYITKIESGVIGIPSLDIASKLISAYHVNPYAFFNEDETTIYLMPDTDEVELLKNKLKRYEKLITKLNEEMVGKTDKK